MVPISSAPNITSSLAHKGEMGLSYMVGYNCFKFKWKLLLQTNNFTTLLGCLDAMAIALLTLITYILAKK